jgi:hypothetical protein
MIKTVIAQSAIDLYINGYTLQAKQNLKIASRAAKNTKMEPIIKLIL